MDSKTPRNGRQLTGFFIPLAIQAASQALSYPLVAMVASRGPGGPLNLAGLAQSTTVMVFLGIFGLAYVTTGMVYAASREGYFRFRNVVLMTGLGVVIVQGLLSIPAPAHLLFGEIIGLPPSIETPAKITLLASIPVQFLFFLRTPYLVIMYINKATAKARNGNGRSFNLSTHHSHLWLHFTLFWCSRICHLCCELIFG